MVKTNLEMVRAKEKSFDIQITENGNAVNLTNGTLYFTVKWTPKDVDAQAVFQKSSPSSGITILSAPNGTANITIDDSDTTSLPFNDVNLFYDIDFIDGSGNPWTVMYGNLHVYPNISRI